MRKNLLLIGTALAALTLAGTAAAAGRGAAVVKDEGCATNFFATTCTVVKTTTNTAETPSGNFSYVTNGSVERTITFAFGGTYSSSNSLHAHALVKQGEYQTASDHYEQLSEYVSGTYHLSCVESYDIHWTNGDAQFANSQLECAVL